MTPICLHVDLVSGCVWLALHRGWHPRGERGEVGDKPITQPMNRSPH